MTSRCTALRLRAACPPAHRFSKSQPHSPDSRRPNSRLPGAGVRLLRACGRPLRCVSLLPTTARSCGFHAFWFLSRASFGGHVMRSEWRPRRDTHFPSRDWPSACRVRVRDESFCLRAGRVPHAHSIANFVSSRAPPSPLLVTLTHPNLKTQAVSAAR